MAPSDTPSMASSVASLSTTASPEYQLCPSCGISIEIQTPELLSRIICPECQTRFTTSAELLHFRLESVLGQGGMGSVFKAYDNNLGRYVALKLLRSDYTANLEYLERLRDEAAIMAQLSHPNVVRVFSIGEDRGQFFLAMELIEHGTLDDVLQTQGQLAEIQALDIGIQAARGLKAAYEAGVLHRDVKPGNILFVNGQTVKITDFGLAELSDRKSSETDEIIGTPYYIPPERLSREPEDCRSDIYSLGATLFHTIAGRPPFEASDATAVALKHLKAQHVSLATYAPHVSSPTNYVINRTLLKDPNQRYQTYDELIEHLEYARNELTAAAGRPQTRTRVVLEDEGEQKLWAWVSIGMLAVVALGGGAFFLFRGTSEGESAKTRTPISAEQAVRPAGAAGTFEAAADLLARSQFDQAAEAFQKVAAAAPSSASSHSWAVFYGAIADLFAGRIAEANTAFRGLGSAKPGHDPEAERLSAFFTNVARINDTAPGDLVAYADTFKKNNSEVLGLLAVALQIWHGGDIEGAASLLRDYRAAEGALRGMEWKVELRGPVTSLLGETAAFQVLVDRAKSSSPEEKISALNELRTVQGLYAGHAQKLISSLEAEIEELRKEYATYPKAGVYRLINRKTGNAMEVVDASPNDDARVQQGKPDPTKLHQDWIFWPIGFGSYRLEARHSGKMLDLLANRSDEGAGIGQWRRSDDLPQQRWNLARQPDGSYAVIAAGTGKALSIKGDSEVVQFSDNGAPEHRWTIEPMTPLPDPVPEGAYMIINANSGRVIDVEYRNTDDGTKIHQWSSDNGAHQRWRLTKQDGGFYKVEATHSGKVMDVNDKSTQAGARVHQWSWRGQGNQQWKITRQGDNLYRLSPRHAQDKVLSVRDSSTENGGELIIADPENTPEQLWIMVPDRR